MTPVYLNFTFDTPDSRIVELRDDGTQSVCISSLLPTRPTPDLPDSLLSSYAMYVHILSSFTRSPLDLTLIHNTSLPKN
jgi:hypothetical protein